MGNDEHSQNVFRKARELGAGSARPTATHGAGVPRRVAQARHLVRRLHPHDRAAAPGRRQRDRAAPARRRRHLRRASTKAGTASSARRSSRRRISSTASARSIRHDAGVDSREELLLPAVEVPQPLLDHFAAHPEFLQPDDPAQRDPAAARRAASRTSRSAAPASRGASRCRSIRRSVVYVWFDALINYASAVGFGTRRGAVRASGGRRTST